MRGTTNPALALVTRLTDIRRALNHLEKLGLEECAQALVDAQVVNAAALVQEFRQRLAQLESALVSEAGRRLGKVSGELADGRQFELKRGGNRTEWRHDEWQSDVRREVVTAVLGPEIRQMQLEHTNLETGEVHSTTLGALMHEALAKAQGVHGAGSPKSTALKGLGLYAGDYSNTTPGPWSLSVVKAEKPAKPGTLRPELGSADAAP